MRQCPYCGENEQVIDVAPDGMDLWGCADEACHIFLSNMNQDICSNGVDDCFFI